MGTTRYTNYGSVNWDIPIWSPDWKQVDSLLTNKEQGYQLAQAALNAPIDSSNLGTDPLSREGLRLYREQAENDLAATYAQPNGLNAGNKALQSYMQQLNKQKQPGGVEYQLMQNKASIAAYQEQINKKEGWSPEKKQAFLNDELSQYKGAVYEGELKGFKGQDLAKYVDGMKMSMDIAKEMIPKTTEGLYIAGKIDTLKPSGRDLYADEYGHLHWDEAKGVELTPQEIATAVAPMMKLNPEWQAYNHDNSRIELYQGGLNKSNFQPLLEKQRVELQTQLDKINNSKDDRQLVSELKGIPLSDLSKYSDSRIKTFIDAQKADLELQQNKLNGITSYEALIKAHADENTNAIGNAVGNIYKRDDLAVTPKNLINEFGKMMMADSLKAKADAKAKTEDELDPTKYWWGTNHVYNTKLDSEFIKNNNEYKELVTNFNSDAKQSAIDLQSMINTYNTSLSDPKNEVGNILRKAGVNPETDGDFFKYNVNPNNGIITFKEPNWNELNKNNQLSGHELQRLQDLGKQFKEQSNNLNALQSAQLNRIMLYQMKTGDKVLDDNLINITESTYKDAKGNILKTPVTYKQIQEVNLGKDKPKTIEQYTSTIIDNIGNPNIKSNYLSYQHGGENESDNFINENYQKYSDYKKSKGEKPLDKNTLKGSFMKREYNVVNDLQNTLALIPEVQQQFKKVFQDKSYKEKEKTYNSVMSELEELTITTQGRDYYINALAFNDVKTQNAVKGKASAYAEQVTNNIKSYAASGQYNNLYDMDGLNHLSDKDDLAAISEALTKMRLPDIDNEDKLSQKNDLGFTFSVVNGEAYGVAKIIFDKGQKFQGKGEVKAINIGFKIDNTMPQFKSYLMDHEQLASEFELQQQKQITNDLNSSTVSKVKYPILGGPDLVAQISETVSPGADKYGQYTVQLFENQQAGNKTQSTNQILNITTNNPYFPTELGNAIVNMEREKDKLALMKDLNFNGSEQGLKSYIIEKLKQQESGLTEVQANEIYNRMIYPRIKDGKAPTIRPSSGNFTNPQNFQW